MKIFSILIISTLIFFISGAAYCENKLTLYYIDRPPYYYKCGDEKVCGIVIDPVVKALKKAGVDYALEELPAKRQLKYLKQNHPNICCIGWYKNPERKKIAKFSKPIYRNKSRIAIASRENTLLTTGKTLEQVFKTPGIALIIKDGFSYGKYIDGKISEFKPVMYKTSRSSTHMIEMIAKRKNSYFFLSEEEADGLIQSSVYQKSDFKYIHFTDTPVGLKRYLMCSKATDDAMINKINKAITVTISINSE